MDAKSSIILASLESIEREIADLKKLIREPKQSKGSLRGMWKGATITDEDIAEAKRSVFKAIHDDEI